MVFGRHRLPGDLTPEEREARIAELRARRRARMRMLAIRSAIGIAALVVLLVVVVWWLLTTFGGHVLKHFEVWTDEVDQNGNLVPNWY